VTERSRSLRLYDEKEVARILERATELQSEGPAGAPGSRSGMSLEELESIAKEVGIDPAHLKRAARELDTRTPGDEVATDLLGGPLSLVLERTVAGEMDDSAFEQLVVEIQRHTDSHGLPGLMGKTLSWQSETASKTRTLQVMVSSREGETLIRIEERLHQFASGLFAGTVAGVGGGIGIGVGLPVGLNVLGSALFAVAFPLGVIGLTYMGCKEIYRQVVRKRARRLEDLLEGLTDVVERSIRRQLPAPGDRPDRI
jgi:hypothetical protein